MRSTKRLAYWMTGLGGTAAWTWLLLFHTAQPLPAALALGAIGLVGTLWGDAVLFPAERPEGRPSAPGRMSRDEALEHTETLARQRSTTPAERPAGRPRATTGRTPPPGAAPRWANPGASLAKPD